MGHILGMWATATLLMRSDQFQRASNAYYTLSKMFYNHSITTKLFWTIAIARNYWVTLYPSQNTSACLEHPWNTSQYFLLARKHRKISGILLMAPYMSHANVTTSELTIHSRQLHRQPRCRILTNIFEILRASEMISPCRSVFGNYRAIRLAPALSYPNGDGCSLNSKL